MKRKHTPGCPCCEPQTSSSSSSSSIHGCQCPPLGAPLTICYHSSSNLSQVLVDFNLSIATSSIDCFQCADELPGTLRAVYESGNTWARRNRPDNIDVELTFGEAYDPEASSEAATSEGSSSSSSQGPVRVCRQLEKIVVRQHPKTSSESGSSEGSASSSGGCSSGSGLITYALREVFVDSNGNVTDDERYAPAVWKYVKSPENSSASSGGSIASESSGSECCDCVLMSRLEVCETARWMTVEQAMNTTFSIKREDFTECLASGNGTDILTMQFHSVDGIVHGGFGIAEPDPYSTSAGGLCFRATRCTFSWGCGGKGGIMSRLLEWYTGGSFSPPTICPVWNAYYHESPSPAVIEDLDDYAVITADPTEAQWSSFPWKQIFPINTGAPANLCLEHAPLDCSPHGMPTWPGCYAHVGTVEIIEG